MVVSNVELDALQGLPLGAQVLYLRELRRHMDYATGVVGMVRRISWQGLRETLETEPQAGIARVLPSKDQVRRLVGHLVRRGLVLMVSDMVGKQLIMRLPLAVSDLSVPEKAATKPPQTHHSEPATIPTVPEANNGAGFGGFDISNPPEGGEWPNSEKPPHIRYPLSVDDEVMARAGEGMGAGGGSPSEVGGLDGSASAGVATADFRQLLGQDGAPTKDVLMACVKVAAVRQRREVSTLEMQAAIADARSRRVRSVASYAATVIESGSLVAERPARVVPLRPAGARRAAGGGDAVMDFLNQEYGHGNA